MDDIRNLLACPACQAPLSAEWACAACGARFSALDGIPNLRLDGDPRTEIVRQFYERTPFPGYPLRDDLASFRARADRSRFAQLLDAAIPGDARLVEVGCGTGQMSLYLARSDRVVIGADLSRAALQLATAAARRYGIAAAQFVETDLHRPGLRLRSFDVVYSSGVLHHAANPATAFARIAALARPGGVVIVGIYNAIARIPAHLRRTIARLTGFRIVPFDPVLRDRRDEHARREAWLRDQYQHPEEHCHSVSAVKRWFADNGVEYLRSFPSTVFEDDGDALFAPAADDWKVEAWLAQLGWMWTRRNDGGLFVMVGRQS